MRAIAKAPYQNARVCDLTDFHSASMFLIIRFFQRKSISIGSDFINEINGLGQDPLRGSPAKCLKNNKKRKRHDASSKSVSSVEVFSGSPLHEPSWWFFFISDI